MFMISSELNDWEICKVGYCMRFEVFIGYF